MTDKYPGLFDGAIDERAYVINAIADEQITIGSPVILVAPAAGELLPRVEPTAVQGARIYGVVVGGDSNGTYGGASEIAAEAGEAVKVCVNGRCKARVDGVIRAIAIGDPLTASGTDGVAEGAIAADFTFGTAQQPSTASTDFIAVFVDQEGIL
ncbi:hypothetical protein KAR91_03635 [Candidatus Pacearchaeota archaeon]|nr:hypothetical protein [Candidatus Pacearchaeota archaeon]